MKYVPGWIFIVKRPVVGEGAEGRVVEAERVQKRPGKAHLREDAEQAEKTRDQMQTLGGAVWSIGFQRLHGRPRFVTTQHIKLFLINQATFSAPRRSRVGFGLISRLTPHAAAFPAIFPLPGRPDPRLCSDRQEDIMDSHFSIYALAQRIIDRYGPEAEDHAAAMLRRCLENDDLPGAGTWLAIGGAVDGLRHLPPAQRRH